MTPDPRQDSQSEWNEVARAKLVRVFGTAIAEAVEARVLRRMGVTTLSSADDLYRFSRALSRDPDPVAAAVGGLLGLTALLRGANGD